MRPSGKRIIITGGAGYLGKNLIEELYEDNHITIYSRDESKHYFLMQRYPQLECVVGDIRDSELLTRSVANHDYAIFAASMKQIAACDQNPSEAMQIIGIGGINSKNAALQMGLEAACFVSSDKSRGATTIYGALKFAAGESFVIRNKREIAYKTRLSTVVYGNVLNSTGSIIPLIWEAIKNDMELKLFGHEITRFILTVEEATALIYTALSLDSCSVVPKARSCRIRDLFDIYATRFGLRYGISRMRTGEKAHETLATREEIERMEYSNTHGCYIIYPDPAMLGMNKNNRNVDLPRADYESKDYVITRDELESLLESKAYYKTR